MRKSLLAVGIICAFGAVVSLILSCWIDSKTSALIGQAIILVIVGLVSIGIATEDTLWKDKK